MGRMVALLLLLASPALAQRMPHGFWGGPDSPGGLLGGDPREADTDRDERVTEGEFWRWARGRAERMDRDGDHALTSTEFGLRRDAPAMSGFRAADADRNGRLTMAELEAVAMAWFRARDRNGDLVLHPAEMPRRAKRAPSPAPTSPR